MSDLHSEQGNRLLHRQMRGTEDIDPINLDLVDQRHRPTNSSMSREFLIKHLAPGSGQLFGIIQSRAGKTLGQDHRSGRDRTGERPATRLVHPHDIHDAAGVEGVFESQIRHFSFRNQPSAA